MARFARAFSWALPLVVATGASAAPAVPIPIVDASDVDRFFAVFHAADGHPGAAPLQVGYLDRGSAALHDFVRLRQLTADGLADAVAQKPEIFDAAERCARLIPAVRARLQAALTKLATVYPPAQLPPATFLIGRGKTGGTTSRTGVLIGLETLCSVDVLEPDLEDRLVHLLAHEYAHVQQTDAVDEMDGLTVLHASLLEGGAEFVGELISGSVSYVHLQRWTRGREREIEEAFVTDQERVDKQRWLWSGLGSPDSPGDLGYWVGYRIAKAYYLAARDKPQAVAEILSMSDPHAFLAKSGWAPGRPDL